MALQDIAVDPTTWAQGNIMYYNGTAWVVLAPGTAAQVLQTGGAGANPSWAASAAGAAAAVVAQVATQEATTAANVYQDLTTVGPSVTVTVGASGNLLIAMSAVGFSTVTTISDLYLAPALSGANVVAAADANAAIGGTNLAAGAAIPFVSVGRMLYMTALSAGSTTVKLQYRPDNSNAWNVKSRTISVWVL